MGLRNLKEAQVTGGKGGRGNGMVPPGHRQCPVKPVTGHISCAGLPSLQLVFQSGEWGHGWGGGGNQDQKPNSVLFTMIN